MEKTMQQTMQQTIQQIEGILVTKDYVHFKIESSSSSENGSPVLLKEFSGASFAGKAFPGDTVTWNTKTNSCTLVSRTKHRALVGRLELASKIKYGITSRGVTRYLFIPMHKHYPPFIVGSSESDTKYNRLALVDFDEWTSINLPKANLRQLIGICGNLEAERQAILLHYTPFQSAKLLSKPLILKDAIQEPPRTHCPPCTFNIDPPGCKDIDDVLSIEECADSNILRIWITISDVAAYILEDSDYDTSAKLQAFTAYSDGNAVKPMLPYTISESRCSLLPGQPRLGISLLLNIDKHDPKKILETSWCLSTVKNKTQYEYDTFVSVAKQDGIPVELLGEIASGLLGKETNDPHEWVEAFMLTYNLEAAKILHSVGKGILRKHDGPDLEKLAAYTALGSEELMILANSAAKYCLANDSSIEHYGLQAAIYCHATSPIRRYADLVNQRVLRAHILQKPVEIQPPNIVWLNQRQKELKSYERDLFFLKQVLSIDSCASNTVSAIVVTTIPVVKLWITSWKRLIKWDSTVEQISDHIQPGSILQLSYFANPQNRSWKERIVFRIDLNRTQLF
jgi:exoribonuclease R